MLEAQKGTIENCKIKAPSPFVDVIGSPPPPFQCWPGTRSVRARHQCNRAIEGSQRRINFELWGRGLFFCRTRSLKNLYPCAFLLIWLFGMLVPFGGTYGQTGWDKFVSNRSQEQRRQATKSRQETRHGERKRRPRCGCLDVVV